MSNEPRYPDLEEKELPEQVSELKDYIVNLHRYIRYANNHIDKSNLTRRLADEINTFVDDDGVIHILDEIDFNERVDFTDYVTFTNLSDPDDQTVIDAGHIKTGIIDASVLNLSSYAKFSDLANENNYTIIHGGNILTGTIDADQLSANAVIIGGVNLLANSKKDAGQSHSTYNVCDFDFTEQLKEGQKYTLTAKVNVSADKKAVRFYHSGGATAFSPAWLPVSEDGTYTVTFTATAAMAEKTGGAYGFGFCRCYASNNTSGGYTPLTGTANVEWIQIERGNRASDWSSSAKDIGIAGTTIISGGNITTGTIDAETVTVTNIDAAEIKSGKIDTARLNVAQITAGLATTAALEDYSLKTQSGKSVIICYKSAQSGTNTMAKPDAKVTDVSGDQRTWTTKRPQYDSNSPVLFLCWQTETVSGDCGWTTPVKDDTTTVIDGGHITTGTIDAARIAANSITADKLDVEGIIAAGGIAISSDITDAVNDIEIGGRNLLREAYMSYCPSCYRLYQFNLTENLVAGETYILQFWDVLLDSNSTGLRAFYGGGEISLGALTLPDDNGYWSVTFTVNNVSPNAWIHVYNYPSGHTGANGSIGKWKLEKGNKATDWTPAPEDVDANIIDAVSSSENFLKDAAASRTTNFDTTDQYTSYYYETEAGKAVTNGNTTDLFFLSYDWSVSGSTTGSFYPQIYSSYIWVVTNVISAIGTGSSTSPIVDFGNENTSGHVEIIFKLDSSQVVTYEQRVRFRAYNGITVGGSLTISNVKFCHASAGTSLREQRIYYRSNSTTAPTAPASWVTSIATANSTWTTKRMEYNQTYKYLWTCIQTQTAGGAISNSAVLLDDTTTVIDGGNLITGTVTANKLNVADINASNKITIGALTADTQSDILNSEIEVGGRNLLINSTYPRMITYQGSTVTAIYDNVAVPEWGATDALRRKVTTGTSNIGLILFGSQASVNQTPFSYLNGVPYTVSIYVKNNHSGNRVNVTNNIGQNVELAPGESKRCVMYTTGNGNSSIQILFRALTAGNDIDVTFWHPQVEYGNMVTEWTPCPADLSVDGATIIHGGNITTNTIKADKLSIGANDFGSENLLKNSSFSSNLDGWTMGGTAASGNTRISINASRNCLRIDGAIGEIRKLTQSIFDKIKFDTAGEQVYTLSADIRVTNYVAGTTNPYAALVIYGYYDNGGTSTWMGIVRISGTLPNNGSNLPAFNAKGWQRVNLVFKFSEHTPTDMSFSFYIRDCTGYFYFRNVKLERGYVATDWTPAPDDIDDAIDGASQTATKYITSIDSNGISIHAENNPSSNYTKINANGMTVYKGGNDVASFGDTARIGKSNSSRFLVNSDSLEAYNSSNEKYFSIEENEIAIYNGGTKVTNIDYDPYLDIVQFGIYQHSTSVVGSSVSLAGIDAFPNVYIDGDPIHDFVIMKNTGTKNNTWYYRKWRSGKQECWGRFTLTGVAFETASGALYTQASALSVANYPSNFSSIPSVHIMCDGTTGAWATTVSAGTQAKPPTFKLMRTVQNTSSQTVYVDIYAIG